LIKRAILFAIIAATLVGCATTSDPIDRLVSKISSGQDLMSGGFTPLLPLPATASTEEIISKEFSCVSYKILQIRQIHIQGNLYTAVLVQTDVNEKILLIHPWSLQGKSGWWVRVYDAKTLAWTSIK
jgi:hypothetical protein